MNTSVGISGTNCGIDYLLEEDGTLVYMIDARYGGNSSTQVVELKCVAMPFVVENGKYTRDMDGKKSTILSTTLKNTGTQQKVTGTEPAVYSDCGVRVDKITLKGSAMSTYAEIEFTVVDANKYAESDGIFFEFLDRYGEPIPNGAGSGGISRQLIIFALLKKTHCKQWKSCQGKSSSEDTATRIRPNTKRILSK